MKIYPEIFRQAALAGTSTTRFILQMAVMAATEAATSTYPTKKRRPAPGRGTAQGAAFRRRGDIGTAPNEIGR